MLNIGKKKYRNLQEQVCYNTKEIERLFSILDGIDYEDHVVVIQDISIPLTEEEMLIVNEPVSFLVYNDKLYFKDSSDEDKLYFSAVMDIEGIGVITINQLQISIDINTARMELINKTADFYNTEEIDEKVSDLQTIITNMGDGSPKGVYPTLEDLETAFPTGTEGIYLVSGGVYAGHWFYWNGAAWTDGGMYLSSVDGVRHSGNQLLDEDGNNLFPVIADDSIEAKHIKGITLDNLMNYAKPYGAAGRYYLNNGGVIESHGNAAYRAFLLDVEPSTQYSLTFGDFIIRCDDSLTPVDTQNVRTVRTFNTNTATKIILSFNITQFPVDTYVFSKGNVLNGKTVIPAWFYNNRKNPEGLNYSYDSLSTNTAIDFDNRNSFIEEDRFSASFDIPNGFTSVEFGKRRTTSNKQLRFVINATKITIYNDVGGSFEYDHGLTFVNNVQINIKLHLNKTCDIQLSSNGIMFSVTTSSLQWSALRGYNYFICGDDITNVSLSYINEGLKRDIVIFGDSYAQNSSNRWLYYLKQNGYTNNLVNAYPGETSANAEQDMHNVLKMGNFRYAIWILGMNDSSYSDWYNNLWSFLAVCSKYKIEPILATIPTVPDINNEDKNDLVRNSGHRYIDFAKAVGANSSGVWFSGMLHTDNVHPTAAGAKALYLRALADFPELMLGK